DLIVDLVGVAGHAVGDATHKALKRGAVQGRLARHVCHKVSGENLGALVGYAVVVADGAAHERLVRVQCHGWYSPHAAAGAGMTPSCCNIPSWSQLAQSSTHFPRSSKRAMTITPATTC